jgi:hypothetical protein
VTNLQRDFLKKIGLKAWDLPIERETRIVSKRVAEHLYGEERVEQYIEGKIKEAIEANDSNDESDWRFVRELSSSASCHLAHETLRLYQSLAPHREHLETLLHELKEFPNFRDIDLDALFSNAVSGTRRQ